MYIAMFGSFSNKYKFLLLFPFLIADPIKPRIWIDGLQHSQLRIEFLTTWDWLVHYVALLNAEVLQVSIFIIVNIGKEKKKRMVWV